MQKISISTIMRKNEFRGALKVENTGKLRELSDRIKITSYDSFPDIELYMDQVLDFLSRDHMGLREDDKVSSAMVNNYIKAEILPRARGKKYSKEHLAHLAVIFRIKQVLSVKDTGALIKINKIGKSDKEFFDSFCEIVETRAEEMTQSVLNSDKKLADIAMELAVQSYLSKIASEYLLDSVVDYYYNNPKELEAVEKEK